VSATAYVDAPCGFWVTPLKIFGGNYAPGVAIPFVWNSVVAKVTLPIVGTVSRTSTANGLGDIEFFPVEDDKSFVCKAEKVAAERACKPHTRSSMSMT